jgi:branched-chain amino acid transport system substrate-binding protein
MVNIVKKMGVWVILFSVWVNIGYAKSENKNIDIQIGIYAPFSNKQAFIGRNILGAMELAREKFPINTIHYSFYTLDALSSSDKTAGTVLEKFVAAHKINILFTEGSTNGRIAAPIAKRNNLIHFSMASDPAIADGVNNFLAWSPEYEQAAVLVKTLNQKQIKTIGLIATNELSDQVLSQSISTQLNKSSDIKIVAKAYIKAQTKDYTRLVNQLKSSIPELYVIMASPQQIDSIQSAMKKAHINKPITSIVERVTPTVMKVFNDQWYIDTHEMKPEFIKEYQEAYINYPTTEAGYAFDVLNLLNKSMVTLLNKQDGFSITSLAKQLHFFAPGKGVMGPFNLDKQGVLYTQSEVKNIKNGHILTT